MKHIQKLSGFGKSRYFHHRHGVVYINRRFQRLTLYMSTMFAIGGVFLLASQFAVPAVKHLLELQKQQQVAVSAPVYAAPVPDQNVVPNIGEQGDDVLKSLIEDKLNSFPKDQKWSVFMYDLKSGNTVKINADKIVPAGSLYKLFLLEALESKLPYDNWSYTWTGGINISDCVTQMLQKTDSACAEKLSDYIGWGVVNNLNRKNGFDDTSLAGTDGRTTSAGDVGKLLIRLQKGEILTDNTRRFVFDTLYQQISKKGISAGCKDCRVADKIGETSDSINDAGIVTHGEHSYVLVVMSQGGSLKQIGELTKTIEER